MKKSLLVLALLTLGLIVSNAFWPDGHSGPTQGISQDNEEVCQIDGKPVDCEANQN